MNCLVGRTTLVIVALVAAMAALRAAPPALGFAPAAGDERSLEDLLGAPVTGRDGGTLGEIRDFLADAPTSRIAFAVVSSGGVAGLGEVLRLVPIHAITRQPAGPQFAADLNAPQWDDLLTLNENELERGRIALTIPEASKRGRAPPGGFGSAAVNDRLVPLAYLSGKDVAAGERDVGEIEDVALDFSAGTVRLVLDPEREFAGTGEKLLVPLDHFAFSERSGTAIQTRLTRAEINTLRPSWNQTTGPQQPPDVAERHREIHYGRPAPGQGGGTPAN